MLHSISQGFRQVRRHRKLSIAIVVIMALCIGSCVVIASIVRAVLLADFGYAEPDRLAIIWHTRPGVAGVVGVGPGDYMSYRSSLQTADAIAAVTTRGFNLGVAPSTRVTCARMTASMLPLLGVRTARGRWFTDEDDRAGTRVVVISERLWRASMAGQGDPIDRNVVLDGRPHRVIGVMSAAFTFPPEGVQGLASAECWLPAGFTPAELAIPSFSYVLFARLKHGVSIEQATADAHAGAQRIWSTYPAALQSQIQLTARVVPLREQILSRSRTPLALFAIAVAALLLIGAANASNVILTGLESRRIELTVRAALGATRGALLRQVLFESIALAVCGGLLGLILAEGLLYAIIAVNASALPRLGDARIDGLSVLVAVVFGILTGAAGSLPAVMRWRTLASAHTHGLRAATRSLAYGLSGVLVAIELALAVVVLVLGGMLARTVIGLKAIDSGFDPEGLLTFAVALPETSHPTSQTIQAFCDDLQQRLKALHGISSVAVSSAPPVGEGGPGVVFRAGSATPEFKPSLVHLVSPDYARALGLNVRDGRFIDRTDGEPGTTVAVINETLSRALFPEGHAVGQSFLRVGSRRRHLVVGVAADVRQAGPQRVAAPAVYIPFAQAEEPVRTVTFVLRSHASLRATAQEARRVVAEVDPTLPTFAVQSGSDLLSTTIAAQRFHLLVVTVFAVFAVTLALSGVYAVLLHVVQQTQRESGIRMALGATGGRIIRAVGAGVLVPAVAGIAAGTAGAAASSQLIASLLFGVKPNDPATLAVAAVAILLASIVAVVIPVSRAARVDLVTLLRHE